MRRFITKLNGENAGETLAGRVTVKVARSPEGHGTSAAQLVTTQVAAQQAAMRTKE